MCCQCLQASIICSEVALLGTGTSVTYRQADIKPLRAAFDAFEAECAFEDGRPDDRLHPLGQGWSRQALRPVQALRDEAMRVSCVDWAIRKRWKLGPGIDRAGPCPNCGGDDRFAVHPEKAAKIAGAAGLRAAGVIDLVEVMKTGGSISSKPAG
ncbi:MAG: hypothetical protein H6874_10385 [Hyphomicrobiaceae bacterium]|nr:hypothetical protein [Hyphomicrobiaceae bacterium]